MRTRLFGIALSLLLLAGEVRAQGVVGPGVVYPYAGGGGGGSSTITSGTTATSGCTDGAFLYSLSSLINCGAHALTTAAGATTIGSASVTGTTVPLTVNNGSSTGHIVQFQDNGTATAWFPNGGGLTFDAVLGDKILLYSGALYGFGVRQDVTYMQAHGSSSALESGCIVSSVELKFLCARTGETVLGDPVAVASPVSRALMGESGVGTDISGANLTIAAGKGTGSGAGGTVIFQTAPVLGSGTTAQTLATVLTLPKSGGIQVATGTKPACASGVRGTIYYVAGGAGVLDTLEVCRKDAADAYAWVSLF